MAIPSPPLFQTFFFFNDTATTEIYTLSLHDALPISPLTGESQPVEKQAGLCAPETPLAERSNMVFLGTSITRGSRSEEHTSELQSLAYLVCRLLLEKKKTREGHSRDCRIVGREGSCV